MDKNDVDESLIEATIRRVAEQAARGAEEGPAEPGLEPQLGNASEANEAVTAAIEYPTTPDDALPDEASTEELPARAARLDVDESAIEAAIRRVQAAKADREQEPAPAVPSDEDARVHAQPITFPTRGNVLPRDVYSDAPEGLAAALERIERTLVDIDQTVRLLAAQLNRHPAPTASPPGEPAHHLAAEWEDEAPPLASAGFGAPPRPPIFRDLPAADAERSQIMPPPATFDAARTTVPAFEPEPSAPPAPRDEPRGLDLLPRTYRVTVEDKRRAVDLVPLHRALLGLDGVRDMSLLSYNNGVALVSLETVRDIDTDVLARAVTRAMSREARIETHNERTLVIKLAED